MKRNKRISFLIIIIILLHMILPTVYANTINSQEEKNKEEVTSVTTKAPNEENTSKIEGNEEQEEKEAVNDKDNEDANDQDSTTGTQANIENNKSDETTNKEENEATKENSAVFMSTRATQDLPNGIYTIKTALNTSKVLDVSGGSTKNSANIQIYTSNNTDAQKFRTTYLGDGYYKIESVHAKKSLDVAGAGKANGTNVQQYASNDSDAQKWLIKKESSGYYSIVSKCNGLYLDIAGATTKDGTNVQMYKGNGTKAQLFVFEEIKQPVQTIANGTYTIKTALNTNKVLDISGASTNNGANVQIYTNNNTNAQKFNITYLGNGYYTIQSVHSKKVLDVAGAGRTNGTNVQQYASNNSDAQQWVIKKENNGYYSIVSKCNGLYLDVAGCKTNDGTNIQMFQGNGTKAQLFTFEETEELKQTIQNGMYKIKSAKDTSKVITVSEGSKANSANVKLATNKDSRYQKFHVNYLGNGYYSIRAVHSKASLDVAGAGKTNGTNVQQYEYNGSDAQKWMIKDLGNSKYAIISKCNNLYLDLPSGSTADGTNIQVHQGNGTEAQKFIFEATSAQAIEEGVYEIQSALNTKKVLDIAGGSLANNANLQIWDRANVNQQKFQVSYLSDGSYMIEAVHSNKVLDVAGGGTKNGTNVQQYTKNSSNAQKWTIKDLGDGYYNIISKCNNLYLDVAGGLTSCGTNVQMYQANGSASQKFKFIETGIFDFATIDENKYAGYKAKLQQLQNNHPNWTINVYYTGLDWNTVVNQEDQVISGSPKSLIYDTYRNEWINGTTKYDVSKRWYRASKKAIAYMMDPRNSLTDSWVFQFQDLSSSSGTKAEITKMVSGTFLNNNSCINTIVETAQKEGISPFHLVSRILQEQGRDGSGTLNGHYEYLRKKSV